MNALNQISNLNEASTPPNEIINLNEASSSFNEFIKSTELSTSSNTFDFMFGDCMVMSDIIKFESTLKNENERELFLNQLKGCPIVIDFNTMEKMNQVQLMEWILQRSVRYKSFKISCWNSVYLSTDIINYFSDPEINKQLESLTIDLKNLRKNTSFDQEFSPMYFKRYCNSLKELKKISVCGRYVKNKFNERGDNLDPLLQIVIQTCDKLEEVRLIRCNVSLLCLNSIVDFCPNLKLLCLSNCIDSNRHAFTIQSFFNIVGMVYLIEIDLSFSAVEPKAVTYILHNCYNLEKILLVKLSDLALSNKFCFSNVERNDLKLLVVDISHNGNDSDDVCVLLKKTPNLTEFLAMNTNFIDSVAVSLSENCANLTTLNIAMNNKQLTEGGFILITDKCRKLKVIIISECFNITDKCLRFISVNCIDLETIQMKRCIHITDNGVQTILKDCLKLTAISVDECMNLTNKSFMNINKNLTNLKSISFRNCGNIEEEGVLSLIDICPTNLSFFFCDENLLTQMVVKEMERKFIKTFEELTRKNKFM